MFEKNKSQVNVGNICLEAFNYWWRTIFYQMFFGIVFFTIFMGVIYTAAVKLGLWEQYLSSASQNILSDWPSYLSEMTAIVNSESYSTFYWIFIATLVFLYPLNLGFFKIYRKLDLNEKPSLNDLFAGYQGINFFIYTGFYLFWLSVYMMLFATLIVPLIWIMVTLFSAPLSFFMNKGIFESIRISAKALRVFFVEILICCLIAFLFKYLGILTFFGAVFTFSFWNAMIYSLYKNIFVEVK